MQKDKSDVVRVCSRFELVAMTVDGWFGVSVSVYRQQSGLSFSVFSVLPLSVDNWVTGALHA